MAQAWFCFSLPNTSQCYTSRIFVVEQKNNLFLGRKDEEMVIMALPSAGAQTGGNQAAIHTHLFSLSLSLTVREHF